ncbi:MAG: hypothetical protein ACLSVD_03860 [Eggerthellaceae bacterium]
METYADFATANRSSTRTTWRKPSMRKADQHPGAAQATLFRQVVLQMKSGQEPKELYIGTAGIADENYRRLVVDRRSPVAEVLQPGERPRPTRPTAAPSAPIASRAAS